MKVYQCIHKYAPHIPLFEQKYGVTNDMDFETLRRLLVEDGYASTYILKPALQHRPNEVFYTVWNYARLQHCWARERRLKTRDLSEIKLAQIEEFQPDVFYNFSAFCDAEFIKRLGKSKGRKDVYWNGIIEPEPRTYLEYDGQLSLHRPYVEFWKKRGLAAFELQPGIPVEWSRIAKSTKATDVLFYGQYVRGMFRNRNNLIVDLLRHKMASGIDIRCHLTYSEHRPTIFRIPKLSWTRVRLPYVTFPNKFVRNMSLSPIYGDALYRAVAQARVVVNSYTNNNDKFKSNMRLFESIGLGAFF